jgi:hypothetical protein
MIWLGNIIFSGTKCFSSVFDFKILKNKFEEGDWDNLKIGLVFV